MAPCPQLTCTPFDERRQAGMAEKGPAQSVGLCSFSIGGLDRTLNAFRSSKGEGAGTEDPRFKSFRTILLWKADLQIQGRVEGGSVD